jgi:carbamoyl-phosphate synthase large subunit
MKSVGEAMAFGRSFAEALQKAIRMTGAAGLACHPHVFRDVKEELRAPTDLRIFAVYSALAEGWSADRVYKYAKIDKAFIGSIASIGE